jgi:hypothetical protein
MKESPHHRPPPACHPEPPAGRRPRRDRGDLARSRPQAERKLGKFAYLEYSGLYQLTHMANQRGALRKDDRVDVLANAVAYWLDYMALDSSKAEAAEARKDDEEFAKLVMATQLKGAKFVPDPIHPPPRQSGPSVPHSEGPSAGRKASRRAHLETLTCVSLLPSAPWL